MWVVLSLTNGFTNLVHYVVISIDAVTVVNIDIVAVEPFVISFMV